MRDYLLITVHGDNPPEAEIDARCVRTDQDIASSSPCPNGQTSLITAIKKLAGFDVSDEEEGQGSDGVFRMPIFTQDTLVYNSSLSVSYGNLSDRELVTKSDSVVIQIFSSDAEANDSETHPFRLNIFDKFTTEVDLEPDAIGSVKSIGKLFNNSGDTVYQSGVSFLKSGEFILLTDAVSGNISVDYTATGFEQTLTIEPREGEPENNYQSTLYIYSSCGNVISYEVDVPQCFQKSYWNKIGYPTDAGFPWDGGYPGGGGSSITSDFDPPNARKSDIGFVWNECSYHELIDGDFSYFDNLPGEGDICYPGNRCVKGVTCDTNKE